MGPLRYQSRRPQQVTCVNNSLCAAGILRYQLQGTKRVPALQLRHLPWLSIPLDINRRRGNLLEAGASCPW
jgi:hypothetical protein